MPLYNFYVGLPQELVTIDIVGPFPETPQGNRYILLTTNCFTKFVETSLSEAQTHCLECIIKDSPVVDPL